MIMLLFSRYMINDADKTLGEGKTTTRTALTATKLSALVCTHHEVMLAY